MGNRSRPGDSPIFAANSAHVCMSNDPSPPRKSGQSPVSGLPRWKPEPPLDTTLTTPLISPPRVFSQSMQRRGRSGGGSGDTSPQTPAGARQGVGEISFSTCSTNVTGWRGRSRQTAILIVSRRPLLQPTPQARPTCCFTTTACVPIPLSQSARTRSRGIAIEGMVSIAGPLLDKGGLHYRSACLMSMGVFIGTTSEIAPDIHVDIFV